MLLRNNEKNSQKGRAFGPVCTPVIFEEEWKGSKKV